MLITMISMKMILNKTENTAALLLNLKNTWRFFLRRYRCFFQSITQLYFEAKNKAIMKYGKKTQTLKLEYLIYALMRKVIINEINRLI